MYITRALVDSMLPTVWSFGPCLQIYSSSIPQICQVGELAILNCP